MTVKELIDLLKKEKPDAEVFIREFDDAEEYPVGSAVRRKNPDEIIIIP